MTIKISACVITKNEEKNISRWLSCMQRVADEMIVVDTGSTDRTVELAKAAGAKLYHFDWINDFAAAKNYALEQAAGDWVLFLDADESFMEEAQKVLRKELERFDCDQSVACLLCRLIDIDVDNDNRVFNTSLLPRVFRNSPYIRYAGAIHEQLENRQGNKKMVFTEKLEILHTGYSSSIAKAKSDRNLPIMLNELAKATTEKQRRRLYPYLMDAYNGMAQYDKAIEYAEKCIRTGYQMIGATGNFYEVIIMAMYNDNRPYDDILAKIDEAVAAYPEEPFFELVRSMIMEKQHDYIGAEMAVLKGLELRKKQEGKMRKGVGVSDTSVGLVPYAFERLGNIYRLKGDNGKAAANYLSALKYHKYQNDSLKGLLKVLNKADAVEIIQILNTIYDRNKDAAYLLRTLKGIAAQKVLAYYGKEVQEPEIGYLFMAGGRYDSAGVALGRRYKELSQLGVLSAYNMENFPQDGYLNTLISPDYQKCLLANKADGEAILSRLKNHRLRNKLDKISFPEAELPLVSIMIPTYNRPELFERTLMSAINQSYSNVEILVNDNSTSDATETLMRKYAGITRLHYLRNKNASTKAENFMPFEKQARGQYLQWCMDDDILAEDKLTKMVPVLRDNQGITLVTSRRGFIDGDDQPIEGDGQLLSIPDSESYGYYYGEDIARQMLITSKNLIGEPSAVLFRRNDLTNHYWQAEAKGYKTISDVAMWCELLEKGHCIVFKDALSYYRRHDQQEGQRPEIILLSRLEWMQLITSYYDSKKFITTHEIYKQALSVLYSEYKNQFSQITALKAADNYAAYREAMELITRLV